MKQIVVDTNVLLSFLTNRDLKQQAQAQALFSGAESKEIALVLHQVVIGEMVYVLKNLYEVEASEIAGLLSDLLGMAGILPVDDVRWTRVLTRWPSRIPDFADAVLATVTVEKHYDAIATFDQRFVRKLKREGIPSVW